MGRVGASRRACAIITSQFLSTGSVLKLRLWLSGREFLHAYILAVEVACRLANGIFGEENPGWHVTGATGGIGAAAGVGRLLGLDADKMTAAFGIARGDRIAQLVVQRVEEVEWREVDELDDSARGTGGWGSTGRR